MYISDWISNNYIEIFGAVTGILYVILEIRQNIWLWPVGIITSGVYIWIFFTGKLYADMSLQGYYLVISVFGWYWWVKGGRRQVAGGRHEGENLEEGMEQEADTKELPSLESLSRPKDGRLGVDSDDAGLRAQGSGPETVVPKLPSLEGPGVGLNEGKERDSETEGLRDEGTERLVVSRLKFRTGIALAIVFVLLWTAMWLVLDRLTDSPVPVWDSFITSLSVIATWMLARKIYEHWFLWIVVNAASVVLFLTRGFYPTVILYAVYCSMSFAGLSAWRRTIQE